MHVSIADLPDVIVLWGESDVALFIDPYGERVPIRDKYPLPDVELLAMNEQRVLYVLLDNPLPCVDLAHMLHHLVV